MSATQNTIVVTAQPQTLPGQQLILGPVHGHRDWSSGLFSCFDDMSSCLVTWCCWCAAVTSIATRTGECYCMPCCVPGALIALRARIRTLGGIQGSVCNDCLVVNCCEPCAVCQMQRELNAMGL